MRANAERRETPMHEAQPSYRVRAVRTAYVAAVLFAVSLARFFFIPRLGLPADSPLAAHLLLFPVVAALSAPPWARATGYGWLVIDIATDIMALNGVADTLYLPMRYGGHVSAALWIAAASWQALGPMRIVGVLLALDLGVYSFIPNGPTVILFPSGLLLPLWFALGGHSMARDRDTASGQQLRIW